MGNQMSSSFQTVGMCALDGLSPGPTPLPTTTSCSLMQAVPAPHGVTCGFLGYLSRPDIVADWAIASSDANPQTTCIKACWDLENCHALSYDQDTRQCALYSSAIQFQKPRKSRTGARFFEPDCFYQTCEISEIVERNETRSELDSPLADFRLRHCNLEETTQVTNPKEDYESHAYFPVDLPFPVQLYGSSSDSLYMSINGYLSFTVPFMTHPEPHSLPHYTHMAKGTTFDMMPSVEGGLPEHSLCALWTEQEIVNSLTSSSPSPAPTLNPIGRVVTSQQQVAYGVRARAVRRDIVPTQALELESDAGSMSEQGMRYAVTGTEGARKVTFTWKTSKKGDSGVIYDYDVVYREDTPGVWMLRYRSVGGVGKTATVGAQSTQANARFVQYNSDSTPVFDGMTLVLHSPSNSFRRVRKTVTNKAVKK